MPTSDGLATTRVSHRVGALGALALVPSAAACGAPNSPSYMRPAGPAADAEATLGWWLTGVSAAVVVVVTAVLLVAIFRRRPDAGGGRERPSARRALAVDDAHPPATDAKQGGTRRHGGDSGLPWIYWGTGVSIVVLVAAFVGIVGTLRAVARPPSVPTLTLDITGHQWWWEAQYHDSLPEHAFYTANELHIPVGRPVRVRLRAGDVIHSFWVPELAGKTDVIPGQINEMWLEASRAGRYRGQCAEYCGMEHAKMALYVVADPPAEFERWAAGQRASAVPLVPAAIRSAASGRASQPVGESMPATRAQPVNGADEAGLVSGFGPPVATPSPAVAPTYVAAGGTAGAGPTSAGLTGVGPTADSLARAGQAVFLANCGACHAVRGSDALGRVGPDLTHVASRATIAGGILPNTTGNLAGWVANAQTVKPGARMPALPLPPNDLLAVVHYLQTLR
ncbi:hypothetical protein tb265_47830 [Gemmatimonadetes bacterium T265]|nr:hypothetical protein tb265_47830 [Gemmatimonadetes bacterium T265]